MKKTLALLLALAMVMALAACGAPAEEAPKVKAEDIIGTWVMGNMKQEFKEDGSGTIMMSSGITMVCDWTFKNGKFIIGYAMGEKEATITVNEDGTLVLHYDGGEYTK